jgi:hypothetical protein
MKVPARILYSSRSYGRLAASNWRNRSVIEAGGLESQWGYALEAEVVILNELKEPEARERRAMANKLKPLIAAPPATLSVNRKGMHPYDLVNRLMVLAYTNDSLPITLPTQDRRWFCVWTHAPRMTTPAADALWGWYETGGYEKCAAWLAARRVIVQPIRTTTSDRMEAEHGRAWHERSRKLSGRVDA